MRHRTRSRMDGRGLASPAVNSRLSFALNATTTTVDVTADIRVFPVSNPTAWKAYKPGGTTRTGSTYAIDVSSGALSQVVFDGALDTSYTIVIPEQDPSNRTAAGGYVQGGQFKIV